MENNEALKCRKLKSQEEEEEEEDGPPPGFHSIILNSSSFVFIKKDLEIDEDEDGPPPGFHSVPQENIKKDEKIESFLENINDDDGPPPGFQSVPVKNIKKGIENEKNESFIENTIDDDDDDDDDGPPPGFCSAHVIRQSDDVSMCDSHSILVVEPEKGDGLNPDFRSESEIFDGSELGFRSVHVKEEGKSGDGVKSSSLEESEVELELVSEKRKEKIIDVSGKGFELGLESNSVEESGLGLQSISVEGEVKIKDVSEVGFESVSHKEEAKGGDEFEIGFKPIRMIEDEKEETLCGTGVQSILEKEVGDDDEGPPPGWGSFPPTRPQIGCPRPPHQSPSRISPRTEFESAHIKQEEKAENEFEVGSQLDPMKEDGKVNICSERESQSFPAITEEKGSTLVKEKEDDGHEGPPPGWFSSHPSKEPRKAISPPNLPLLTPAKLDPLEEDGKENNCSELKSQSFPVRKGQKGSTPPKEEEDDDEGPPPGWLSCHPLKEPRKAISPPNLSLHTPAQLNPFEEKGKENDDSELESQSFPAKTEEKGSALVKEKEDDGDEGPPPGWFSCHPSKESRKATSPPNLPLHTPAQLDPLEEKGKENDDSELEYQSFPVKTGEKVSIPPKEEEDDDDDGPPPGWFSSHPLKDPRKAISPPNLPLLTPAKLDPLEEGGKENDDSELESQSVPVKTGEKGSTPPKEEEDDDDEGPPPGWFSSHPSKVPSKAISPPNLPLHTPAKLDPLKEGGKENDDSELESPSFPVKTGDKGSTPSKEEEDDDDDGPPPGWFSSHPSKMSSKAPSPPQMPSLTPAAPDPRPPAASSGKAQMVCGSCQTLISYSKGSRFVQCSCCQTVNLVLEEHQVGQVKCRGCTLLLMYPYGAPSVQCSSCLFVTKIGVQNKRPPLSMQQGRTKLSANQVH